MLDICVGVFEVVTDIIRSVGATVAKPTLDVILNGPSPIAQNLPQVRISPRRVSHVHPQRWSMQEGTWWRVFRCEQPPRRATPRNSHRPASSDDRADAEIQLTRFPRLTSILAFVVVWVSRVCAESQAFIPPTTVAPSRALTIQALSDWRVHSETVTPNGERIRSLRITRRSHQYTPNCTASKAVAPTARSRRWELTGPRPHVRSSSAPVSIPR